MRQNKKKKEGMSFKHFLSSEFGTHQFYAHVHSRVYEQAWQDLSW